VGLYTTEEYSHQPSALQSELHSARIRARLCNARFYLKDAVPVFATRRVLIQGGNLNLEVNAPGTAPSMAILNSGGNALGNNSGEYLVPG
jgi:hypothetical protein